MFVPELFRIQYQMTYDKYFSYFTKTPLYSDLKITAPEFIPKKTHNYSNLKNTAPEFIPKKK